MLAGEGAHPAREAGRRCCWLSGSKILPGFERPAGLGVPPSLSPVCLPACVYEAAVGLAAAQGGGAEAGARPDASFPGTTFPPDQCVAVVPGPDSCGRGVRWVQWKLALGSQAEYECGGGGGI